MNMEPRISARQACSGRDDDLDRLDDEALRRSIVPPARFWGAAAARPRNRTAGSVDYALSRLFPIRYQGPRRQTCVAFALVAAMELCAMRRGKKWKLSEAFATWLFSLENNDAPDDERVSLFAGVRQLSKYGTCPASLCEDEGRGLSRPSPQALAQARYGIARYFLIDRLTPASTYCMERPVLDGPGISNTAYLESILSCNHDIVVTMPNGSQDMREGHVRDVRYRSDPCDFFCTPVRPTASHAMVMVGYNRLAPIPYFVFRDSSQSDLEHIRYSYDYVRMYAQYGVVISHVSDRMPTPPAP